MTKFNFKTSSRKFSGVKNTVVGIAVGVVVTTIGFGYLYIQPRMNAYINAVRIAHENPEAIEGLNVQEVVKRGSFEIAVKK